MPKKLKISNKIGVLGEDIACRFLVKSGHTIVYRNYLKKWGEIDIVSRKDNILHFVEVKAVSCKTSGYRPEENIHPRKLARLERVIQTYLLEYEYDGEWQIDGAFVYLDMDSRKAQVKILSNIII